MHNLSALLLYANKVSLESLAWQIGEKLVPLIQSTRAWLENKGSVGQS